VIRAGPHASSSITDHQPKADIWALGIILLQLARGNDPLGNGHLPSIFQQIGSLGTPIITPSSTPITTIGNIESPVLSPSVLSAPPSPLRRSFSASTATAAVAAAGGSGSGGDRSRAPSDATALPTIESAPVVAVARLPGRGGGTTVGASTTVIARAPVILPDGRIQCSSCNTPIVVAASSQLSSSTIASVTTSIPITLPAVARGRGGAPVSADWTPPIDDPSSPSTVPITVAASFSSSLCLSCWLDCEKHIIVTRSPSLETPPSPRHSRPPSPEPLDSKNAKQPAASAATTISATSPPSKVPAKQPSQIDMKAAEVARKKAEDDRRREMERQEREHQQREVDRERNELMELRDFIRQCLLLDPMARPNARDLLSHPFLANGLRGRSTARMHTTTKSLPNDIDAPSWLPTGDNARDRHLFASIAQLWQSIDGNSSLSSTITTTPAPTPVPVVKSVPSTSGGHARSSSISLVAPTPARMATSPISGANLSPSPSLTGLSALVAQGRAAAARGGTDSRRNSTSSVASNPSSIIPGNLPHSASSLLAIGDPTTVIHGPSDRPSMLPLCDDDWDILYWIWQLQGGNIEREWSLRQPSRPLPLPLICRIPRVVMELSSHDHNHTNDTETKLRSTPSSLSSTSNDSKNPVDHRIILGPRVEGERYSSIPLPVSIAMAAQLWYEEDELHQRTRPDLADEGHEDHSVFSDTIAPQAASSSNPSMTITINETKRIEIKEVMSPLPSSISATTSTPTTAKRTGATLMPPPSTGSGLVSSSSTGSLASPSVGDDIDTKSISADDAALLSIADERTRWVRYAVRRMVRYRALLQFAPVTRGRLKRTIRVDQRFMYAMAMSSMPTNIKRGASSFPPGVASPSSSAMTIAGGALSGSLSSLLTVVTGSGQWPRVINLCPLLLHALPFACRRHIWPVLLHIEVATMPDEYERIGGKEMASLDERQFDIDIMRCHQYHYYLSTSDGQQQIKRVIKVEHITPLPPCFQCSCLGFASWFGIVVIIG
jgi:serine/threonine protein kinase